jgi:nitroreductase
MELESAINTRKSKRAFTAQPIPVDLVKDILKLASRAPSGMNLQPWEVYVVSGEEKERLGRILLKSYKERRISCSPKTQKPLPSKYRARTSDFPSYLSPWIKKNNTTFSKLIDEGSCNFYGAPTGFIICIDKMFPRDRLVDIGIFTGYLILAAREMGLSTCPLGLLLEYQDEVKELLNIPEDKEIAVGLALGYADETAFINSYVSSREDISGFVNWIE